MSFHFVTTFITVLIRFPQTFGRIVYAYAMTWTHNLWGLSAYFYTLSTPHYRVGLILGMNNAVRIGWQVLGTATDWAHILFVYLSGWLPPPKIAAASQTRALLCTLLIKFLKLLHLLQQCHLNSVTLNLVIASSAVSTGRTDLHCSLYLTQDHEHIRLPPGVEQVRGVGWGWAACLTDSRRASGTGEGAGWYWARW